MAVTGNYEFELDGYRLVGLTEISGLDHPGTDMSIDKRAGAHGAYTSGKYLKERVITAQARLLSDVDTMPTQTFALKQAFTPREEDVRFSFMLPGFSPQFVLVKPQDVRFGLRNVETAVGMVEYIGTMVAGDPRIYSEAEKTASASPGGDTGGADFPMEFPQTFSTGGTSGGLIANNAGNFEAPTVITFNGPLTNPSITNSTTGVTFRIMISIPSGSYVTATALGSTVTYDGAGSLYANVALPRRFIYLAPGDNSLSVSSNNGAGQIDIRWRDTWM